MTTLFEVIVIGAVADSTVLVFTRFAVLGGIIAFKNIVHIFHSETLRELIAAQIRMFEDNPFLQAVAETLVTAHRVFRQVASLGFEELVN